MRSTVRALAAVDTSPAFILGKTNELLVRFDPDEPHVTAFLAVLDHTTGHLSYASAGHPAPVRLGAFTCRALDVRYGPPLGTLERPYDNAHAMLTLEDYLVLYTDGVTEARHEVELLGEKRLLEIVDGLRGRSAQEVAEGVRDAALEFAGRLRDDLQVVVLRLARPSPGRRPARRPHLFPRPPPGEARAVVTDHKSPLFWLRARRSARVGPTREVLA